MLLSHCRRSQRLVQPRVHVTALPYLGLVRPLAPPELLARADGWDELTRWERAELGRALRRLGWTYGEIREVIPVPKGTLSYWCREIRLADEQIEAIKTRIHGSRRGVPVDTQWRRRLEIEEIRQEAREEVAGLISEPLWLAGTVMYWAEGAKTKRRLSLVNTDPHALRLYMAWIEAYLDPSPAYVLALHLHEGNDDSAARDYWAHTLGLDDPDFYKSFIKPEGTGHRKNKLPQGICAVILRRSTDSWIRAMAWIEELPHVPLWCAGDVAILAAGSLAQLGRATGS